MGKDLKADPKFLKDIVDDKVAGIIDLLMFLRKTIIPKLKSNRDEMDELTELEIHDLKKYGVVIKSKIEEEYGVVIKSKIEEYK